MDIVTRMYSKSKYSHILKGTKEQMSQIQAAQFVSESQTHIFVDNITSVSFLNQNCAFQVSRFNSDSPCRRTEDGEIKQSMHW